VQALKFDTLGYVKQLTSAGVDPQVAEIHAMTMANASGMYIDNLVTTDYLDATLDKRFAEQDSKLERRFSHIEGDLKVLKWGQAIVVAAVLLPQLAALFA
jgi:hypothetical protein